MRRTLIAFTLVTILAGVFVLVKPAAAQDGLVDGVANAMINAFSSVMISIAGLFIQLTIFALKFFIEIAGYNNYIDADVVQIGWNMVRDIANMFFVVVLLVIAFGTILGLEQYEWKKTLVKLVMAAFFVNFSNLICQLIIDIGQVFTITFLNALAGAAGGNLIKMFNFDEIYNIATRGTDPTGIQLEFFAGSVMTIVFAGTAMFTMGAYLIVMIGRMVVLWTLMILSPLAFLFSALPNTQSYAQEFWNEFIHHVIVAPVMVFFLWLAFATFGGGNIVQSNIEANNPLIVEGAIVPITESTDASGQGLGASFSAAASWENMANFAVAIAFLWMGVERVQKLGVVGGGIVSGALNFGKNVATVASGLALARWMGGGAKNLVSSGVKGALWYAPLVGGEKWQRRFKNEWEGLKSWYYDTGYRPKVKRDEKGNVVLDERGNAQYVKNPETGQIEMEMDPDRGNFQKMAHFFARQDIASEKKLEKTTKYAALQKEYLDKATTGVPRFLLMKDSERVDGIDRVMMGRIKAQKRRSEGKTGEFSNQGEYAEMSSPRLKDGKFDEKKGSMMDQTVGHLKRAEVASNNLHSLEENSVDHVLEEGTDIAKQLASSLEKIELKLKTPDEIKAAGELKLAKIKSKEIDDKAKGEVDFRLSEMDKGFEGTRVQLNEEENTAKAALDQLRESDEYVEWKAEKDKIGKELKDITSKKGKKTEEEKQKIEELRADLSGKYKEFPGEAPLLKAFSEKQAAVSKGMKDFNEQKENETVAIRKKYEQEMKDAGGDVTQKEQALRDAEAAAISARTGDSPEAKANAAEYEKIKQQVEQEKEALQKAMAAKSLGLTYAASKQRAATAKASTEKAEQDLKKASLGVEYIRAMFEEEQNFEIGAQAAKGFIDAIKEQEVGKVFEEGSKYFKKAMAKAFAEGVTKLEDMDFSGSAGASFNQAQVLAEYAKDISSVNKKTGLDQADSVFTMERYGFNAPETAFNEWIKKRMESFQGVEREQAVKIAIGSLSKLLSLQKVLKSEGKELDPDQHAQMMANTKYLTSQAWSDDLLARIVTSIESNKKGKLYGNDKIEADNLEEVFVKHLKWGNYDNNGKLELVNRSGHDRTNDLHRLSAFAGDLGLVQAENAVLRHAEKTKLGYNEAASSLARKVQDTQLLSKIENVKTARANKVDASILKPLEDELERIFYSLGIDLKDVSTGIEEISSFGKNFLQTDDVKDNTGTVDFKRVVEKFTNEIKKHSAATEMMADFKNMALANGHIDDGGHTVFNMDTGFAHGQLAHKALDFVIGDWRKKGLDSRLQTLKSHSVMQMDENSGTAYFPPALLKAFRETFQGLTSQLSYKRLDGRVIDHLAGLAAGEEPLKDATGRMIVGDKNSALVKDHANVTEALKRFADDMAMKLSGNALVAVAALGERSGLDFDKSKRGEMNLTIVNEAGEQKEINNVAQLIEWVKANANSEILKEVKFSESQIMQAFGDAKGEIEEDPD